LQRLREAQSKLDELLLTYTEKHPEVEGLRETIEDLEKRHAADIAAAQGGDSGAASSAGLAASPVYQQIQLNFNQNEVRIATLQAQLEGHRAEVNRLQGLVDTAPGVEAEYAQLNRDYEVKSDAYQALVHRLEQIRLGEEVEEEGAVQFEVIDPPSASFSPVAPKRPPLIAAVLVLALGAGGGLAFVLHLIKPVFSTPAALQEATGLPVIGVVPRTWLDRHRSTFRRNVIQYAGAVGCLVLLAVVVVIQESQLTRLVQQVLQ
jgi:polysaccharide chain length determinant protein (PEP-CTERM system associated)